MMTDLDEVKFDEQFLKEMRELDDASYEDLRIQVDNEIFIRCLERMEKKETYSYEE